MAGSDGFGGCVALGAAGVGAVCFLLFGTQGILSKFVKRSA